MSNPDKLTYLNETKRQLRETINTVFGAKLTDADTFRSYIYALPFWPGRLFLNGEQGAWYDPSDLSTLFQDAAGTTPVTADGDPVGLMLDKSGNGNHATQTVSASRPTYQTDGELHWLAFTTVGVRINMPMTGLFQKALAGEAFIATEAGTGSGNGRFMDFSTGLENTRARFTLYSKLLGRNAFALGTRRLDSGTFSNIQSVSSLGPSVVSAQRDWGRGSGRLRKNSGEWFNGQDLNPVGTTSDTPSLAASIPSESESESVSVDIYGLIVRRGIATDAEIRAVETFLSNKVGVTLP